VCRLPPKDAQNNKVEVVVRFIDIGRIGDHGDHHCLHFRFIPPLIIEQKNNYHGICRWKSVSVAFPLTTLYDILPYFTTFLVSH
jgi:hypothetical protein